MAGDLSDSASLLSVANYFSHEASPLLHKHSKIWVEVFGQIVQTKIRASVSNAAFLQTAKVPTLFGLVTQALTVAYGQTHGDHGQGFLRPRHPGETTRPLAGMEVPENIEKAVEQPKMQNLQIGD